MKKLSILLIDDDPGIQFGFSSYLKKAGYDIKIASLLSEAKKILESQRFEAIILDLKLPNGNGIDILEDLKKEFPGVAIVIITAHGSIPIAVESMKLGVDHFLTKPVKMKELEIILKKSLEISSLRQYRVVSQRLQKKIDPYFGEHPLMLKVKEMASRVASSDSAVLLLGETGSGKGVLARWIHEQSLRREKAFVEVNCSALRGELLASELFGHKRGAFTNALEDKSGLIEVADKGILFLDEIGNMNLEIQSQLLKVIEEKRFMRLGETHLRRSDFRMICASNKNLEEAVRSGEFRKDLFFRINIFPITIPPLRVITENIPGLVFQLLDQMLGRHDMISDDVIVFLKKYHWPGNIRELKSILERAIILSDGEHLKPKYFSGLHQYSQLPDSNVVETLQKYEYEYIQFVLQKYNHDTMKASKALGISRAALYRKIRKMKNL